MAEHTKLKEGDDKGVVVYWRETLWDVHVKSGLSIDGWSEGWVR